jgi:hypothetical protein
LSYAAEHSASWEHWYGGEGVAKYLRSAQEAEIAAKRLMIKDHLLFMCIVVYVYN